MSGIGKTGEAVKEAMTRLGDLALEDSAHVFGFDCDVDESDMKFIMEVDFNGRVRFGENDTWKRLIPCRALIKSSYLSVELSEEIKHRNVASFKLFSTNHGIYSLSSEGCRKLDALDLGIKIRGLGNVSWGIDQSLDAYRACIQRAMFRRCLDEKRTTIERIRAKIDSV
jgi:hypothetical protein